jgi:urease accessory protein
VAAHAGRAGGRKLVTCLVLTWAAGTIAGYALASGALEPAVLSAGLTLLLGATGMLALTLPLPLLAFGSASIGLLRGWANGSGARAADGTWLSAAGVVVGVFVVCVCLTALGNWVAERRAAITLRILGSWMAAIGLLMAGWELRA